MNKNKELNLIKRFATYIILGSIAVGCVLPLFVAGYESLKSEAQFANDPAGLVFSPTFDNFREAWGIIGPAIINSVVIVTPATLMTIFFCSFTGYILSSYSFGGRRGIFATIVSGLGVPPQAYIIPLVIFAVRANLFNTNYGMSIIYFLYSVAGGVLYLTNYYLSSLPRELVESSNVDGCSIMGTYWRIVLPLSPIIVGIVICFNFTSWYNNLLWPLVLTAGKGTETVPVVLSMFSGRTAVKWTLQLAAALIASVPSVTLYLLGSRYVVRGFLSYQVGKG